MFSQDTHDINKWIRLIDSKTIYVTPEGAGCMQANELEKYTNHDIQTNIYEMPQPVEPDK